MIPDKVTFWHTSGEDQKKFWLKSVLPSENGDPPNLNQSLHSAHAKKDPLPHGYTLLTLQYKPCTILNGDGGCTGCKLSV